jgi:gamma-glutamyltranspeptidase/glutathione hydrolase
LHEGILAERLAAFVRSEGGVLSARDLAGYSPVWRPAQVVDFQRWRILTMPLPSSGGFLLTSILAQFAITPPDFRRPGAAESIHVVAEAERRAFADRNRFLGDADCVDVPLAWLLSPFRMLSLGLSIDRARVTSSSVLPASRSPSERPQTTHLSVALPNGEAVSLTTTLNGLFGSGSVVPGLGVLLNNEMDDFATAAGVPNLFGLVQGEANSVRAGARPLSSMTPSIVLEDGRVRLVLGSPGGATIPTTVLQVFLRAGPGGETLADAIAAPRAHHQHVPDRLSVEAGTQSRPVLDELRRLGHEIEQREPIGVVHAAEIRNDGTVLGVADPRGYGAAASVEEVLPRAP